MSRLSIIGITGHQNLTTQTSRLIESALRDIIDGSAVTGVTSLAAGADQVFARVVLELGGKLQVILPSHQYERSFSSSDDLTEFRSLLRKASEVHEMPFDEPSEQAYWAAGQEIVNRVESLVAVWDGHPARGLGGTADVVEYAHKLGKPVTVIWPRGATRN
jgi:hypothetical protein